MVRTQTHVPPELHSRLVQLIRRSANCSTRTDFDEPYCIECCGSAATASNSERLLLSAFEKLKPTTATGSGGRGSGSGKSKPIDIATGVDSKRARPIAPIAPVAVAVANGVHRDSSAASNAMVDSDDESVPLRLRGRKQNGTPPPPPIASAAASLSPPSPSPPPPPRASSERVAVGLNVTKFQAFQLSVYHHLPPNLNSAAGGGGQTAAPAPVSDAKLQLIQSLLVDPLSSWN